MIEVSIGVKCKLTIRGFKGKSQDLDTYARTTSGSGQRIANAVAAENGNFILFSFDVSQAFAKGLAFEEFSRLTGFECRAIQFDVPKADLECLKQLKGFEHFNAHTETLTMLKPIHGLKGAPRARRKKLHQVLKGWQQCQQLHAKLELYCVRKSQSKRSQDPIGRAQAHNLEQQEVAEPRSIAPSTFASGNLQCLLSAHAGVIKGTTPKDVADSLLRHLNESAGQCEADCNSFLHTDIQHKHSPGEVFTHQYVYVDSIQPIKSDLCQGKDDEALCDGPCHEAYRSILGSRCLRAQRPDIEVVPRVWNHLRMEGLRTPFLRRTHLQARDVFLTYVTAPPRSQLQDLLTKRQHPVLGQAKLS